ncbi:class I SAM-dependent methyltransferase [candidate division KSB1 bacterium]|nr:class I SAM-dependent methyltransferase [candidate division KSB1 bacterium]NIR69278.1 class I SAM-dependent methyltransferase [candidate division KSB1 bacterium]NIS24139.1 class I SAM-dependent methyltransferase [candidate division KSB1 bacterium]NIT71053.1 class I SAM-dependent methyltransferase [candidate division KSB1 bacterium]NIU24758.1 class I SAM-dependent methyltransferase [candidate division KSB1 bacterium]
MEADLNGEYLHAGGIQATEFLLKQIKLTPGQRVLDIGCGTGATLVNLKTQFLCNIFAVDISLAMLKRAAHKVQPFSQASLVQADAATKMLPFSANTFDVILAESVAGILDFASALPEWIRVLKPGGTLALNDGLWQKGTSSSTIKKFTNLCEQKFGFSLAPSTYQSINEWKDLLTSAGLINIRTSCAAVQGNVLPRNAETCRKRRHAILIRPHLWPAYLRYRRAMQHFKEVGDYLEYWIILAKKPVSLRHDPSDKIASSAKNTSVTR